MKAVTEATQDMISDYSSAPNHKSDRPLGAIELGRIDYEDNQQRMTGNFGGNMYFGSGHSNG